MNSSFSRYPSNSQHAYIPPFYSASGSMHHQNSFALSSNNQPSPKLINSSNNYHYLHKPNNAQDFSQPQGQLEPENPQLLSTSQKMIPFHVDQGYTNSPFERSNNSSLSSSSTNNQQQQQQHIKVFPFIHQPQPQPHQNPILTTQIPQGQQTSHHFLMFKKLQSSTNKSTSYGGDTSHVLPYDDTGVYTKGIFGANDGTQIHQNHCSNNNSNNGMSANRSSHSLVSYHQQQRQQQRYNHVLSDKSIRTGYQNSANLKNLTNSTNYNAFTQNPSSRPNSKLFIPAQQSLPLHKTRNLNQTSYQPEISNRLSVGSTSFHQQNYQFSQNNHNNIHSNSINNSFSSSTLNNHHLVPQSPNSIIFNNYSTINDLRSTISYSTSHRNNNKISAKASTGLFPFQQQQQNTTAAGNNNFLPSQLTQRQSQMYTTFLSSQKQKQQSASLQQHGFSQPKYTYISSQQSITMHPLSPLSALSGFRPTNDRHRAQTVYLANNSQSSSSFHNILMQTNSNNKNDGKQQKDKKFSNKKQKNQDNRRYLSPSSSMQKTFNNIHVDANADNRLAAAVTKTTTSGSDQNKFKSKSGLKPSSSEKKPPKSIQKRLNQNDKNSKKHKQNVEDFLSQLTYRERQNLKQRQSIENSGCMNVDDFLKSSFYEVDQKDKNIKKPSQSENVKLLTSANLQQKNKQLRQNKQGPQHKRTLTATSDFYTNISQCEDFKHLINNKFAKNLLTKFDQLDNKKNQHGLKNSGQKVRGQKDNRNNEKDINNRFAKDSSKQRSQLAESCSIRGENAKSQVASRKDKAKDSHAVKSKNAKIDDYDYIFRQFDNSVELNLLNNNKTSSVYVGNRVKSPRAIQGTESGAGAGYKSGGGAYGNKKHSSSNNWVSNCTVFGQRNNRKSPKGNSSAFLKNDDKVSGSKSNFSNDKILLKKDNEKSKSKSKSKSKKFQQSFQKQLLSSNRSKSKFLPTTATNNVGAAQKEFLRSTLPDFKDSNSLGLNQEEQNKGDFLKVESAARRLKLLDLDIDVNQLFNKDKSQSKGISKGLNEGRANRVKGAKDLIQEQNRQNYQQKRQSSSLSHNLFGMQKNQKDDCPSSNPSANPKQHAPAVANPKQLQKILSSSEASEKTSQQFRDLIMRAVRPSINSLAGNEQQKTVQSKSIPSPTTTTTTTAHKHNFNQKNSFKMMNNVMSSPKNSLQNNSKTTSINTNNKAKQCKDVGMQQQKTSQQFLDLVVLEKNVVKARNVNISNNKFEQKVIATRKKSIEKMPTSQSNKQQQKSNQKHKEQFKKLQQQQQHNNNENSKNSKKQLSNLKSNLKEDQLSHSLSKDKSKVAKQQKSRFSVAYQHSHHRQESKQFLKNKSLKRKQLTVDVDVSIIVNDRQLEKFLDSSTSKCSPKFVAASKLNKGGNDNGIPKYTSEKQINYHHPSASHNQQQWRPMSPLYKAALQAAKVAEIPILQLSPMPKNPINSMKTEQQTQSIEKPANDITSSNNKYSTTDKFFKAKFDEQRESQPQPAVVVSPSSPSKLNQRNKHHQLSLQEVITKKTTQQQQPEQKVQKSQSNQNSNTNSKLKLKQNQINPIQLQPKVIISSIFSDHDLDDDNDDSPMKTRHKSILVSEHCLLDAMQNCFTFQTNKFFEMKQFEQGKTVGSGRYGDVALARHKKSNTILSIKKILKSTIIETDIVQQFINEIKLHSKLNHVNIIQLYNFFEDQYHIFILMEYADSGTLLQYTKSKEFLSLTSKAKSEKISNIICQLLNALCYMHRFKIIHRDIKLENVLITSSGTVKLCDFGYSTQTDTGMKKTFCGTLDYIAPQIMNKSKTSIGYDQSVDLWAVGVLTYEMFVGKGPYYDEYRKIQKIKAQEKNRQKSNGNNKKVSAQDNFRKNIAQWSEMFKTAEVKYPSDILTHSQKSFIKGLLNSNPFQRLNAFQALSHPFIKEHDNNVEVILKEENDSLNVIKQVQDS